MDLWSLRRIVSQRSLSACRLELEDRPLERASLFPLFDDEGQTRMVMVTTEEHGRILLAEWAPGLFTRDWAWRNRLRLRSTDLNDASAWDRERFEDLWHFDPWWVLGEERYQGHGVVPSLRGTNIPGFDTSVSEITFEPGLGHAAHVVKRSANSASVRRFTPDTLAAVARRRRATHERPQASVALGWRLRPFWRSL